MRILVVHRAWVEWIINDLFSDSGAPRMRGLFFSKVLYIWVWKRRNILIRLFSLLLFLLLMAEP